MYNSYKILTLLTLYTVIRLNTIQFTTTCFTDHEGMKNTRSNFVKNKWDYISNMVLHCSYR
jgi:hypothetical protein